MKGKCNCGAIAFEITGNLPAMYKCHCTLCQKQSGASSNAATIIRASKFRWCFGEEKISKWQKETGFNSHFCKVCGSPVPNPLGTSYMWVPIGLVGNADTHVVANLFVDSKPSWELTGAVEHHFPEAPGDIEQLVALLEGASCT